MMKAVSQAAGNFKAHFAIMTEERYLTYLVKVQGSHDPILIHSAGSALGNDRNRLGHRVKKSFVFQGLKESATAFEVEPTKMLARGNKRGKMPYTELLKAKTPAEIEFIRIPSENRGQNNSNIHLNRYSPITPCMLKKTVEYNSSISQEITVSCIEVLRAFEPTQAAITTLTYAPDTIDPEDQEAQAG